MSIADKAAKAVDKIEESVGEARETTGLGPDDQPGVAGETPTDMGGRNTTHTADTIKDA
jgi:hypothetical protein